VVLVMLIAFLSILVSQNLGSEPGIFLGSSTAKQSRRTT
jgi:hypothetical protein